MTNRPWIESTSIYGSGYGEAASIIQEYNSNDGQTTVFIRRIRGGARSWLIGGPMDCKWEYFPTAEFVPVFKETFSTDPKMPAPQMCTRERGDYVYVSDLEDHNGKYRVYVFKGWVILEKFVSIQSGSIQGVSY